MNEMLLQIREQEIDQATFAAQTILDILQNYSSKEQIVEIAGEYFSMVNILHTAMVRIGMCDYLDNI